MKVFALVILALSFASAAHSSQISIAADQASQLMSALEIAGATGDSGMGRISISANSIACVVATNGPSAPSCHANLQNPTGISSIATLLSQSDSITLIQVLLGAGVVQSCTPAGCRIDVASIDCSDSTGDVEGASGPECRLVQ